MEMKRSFKLSLIFLMAVAPASMALAQQVTPCNFNGWTAGLGLGASVFMSQVNSSASLLSQIPSELTEELDVDITGPLHTSNRSASADIYRYGPMGRIFIGYGKTFDNHMYTGVELGLNVLGADDATVNHNDSDARIITADPIDVNEGVIQLSSTFNTKTHVKRNTLEPTLDLKLGFLMTPTTLVYFRGGFNYNDIKVQQNFDYTASGVLLANIDEDTEFLPSASVTSLIHATHHSRSIGYRAGVGMEVMVTPQIGVSADYIYSWYRNTTAKTSGVRADIACDAIEGCLIVPANQSVNAKVQTDDQQVLAQLIYHFG